MHTPAKAGTSETAGQCWKLVLAYDGTDFHGWQIQRGRRTVQGELARVLEVVTGESTLPQGSGRTDAGVHAEAQVASVTLTAPIPPDRLLRALNRRLPSAIRVMQAAHAPADFHARANVASKVYEYRIFPRRTPGSAAERICPPALARFAWDCRWPMHVDQMQAAAARVVGTHDFTSFAAHDPDRTSRMRSETSETRPTNTRQIFASTFYSEADLLVYRVEGSGFLHHMVRNLVGTFVDIGAGRLSVDDIPGILTAHNRSAAGQTAPPQGLTLKCVHYRNEQPA